MAVREFDGVDDIIRMDGAFGALNNASTPVSCIIVASRAAFPVSDDAYTAWDTSSDSILGSLYTNDDRCVQWAANDPNGIDKTDSLKLSTGWYLIAVTKAASATAVFPEFYWAPLTGSLFHMAGGIGVGASSGTSATRWYFGGFAPGNSLIEMRLAVAALYNKNLTVANVQSVFDAKSTASMNALGPISLCQFNQASTAIAVEDLVGLATQGSITGTTVVTGDDPPGWTFTVSTDPYVAAGAAATATSGNVTAALPPSPATGDALVLEISALDNVNCSVAVAGGSGNAWTRKAAQNNGSGLRQEIWWKRRGSSDADTGAAVTHTGGGKIIARVHQFHVPGTGDPFEAVGGPTNISPAATGSFPNVTTVTNDAMLFYALSYAEDFLTGPAISNAQGLTLTERDETEVT